MEADGEHAGDASGMDEGAQVLVLPAVLDLTGIAELKVRLEAALTSAQGLVADASGVQRVTTPSLQLLAAAKRTFANAGGSGLRFKAPSAAFAQAIETLALGPLFELPGE